MRLFLAISVLGSLVLTGCFSDPVIEADTEVDFNRSYGEVLSSLSPTDQERLDTSLKDIVLVQTGIYATMIEAQSSHIPNTNAPIEGMVNALSDATMKRVNTLVANKWAENRDKSVVHYARAVVDGRNAKEIFVLADSERNRAIEQALATYRDQLENSKSALGDIQAKGNSAAAEVAEQTAFLANIAISKASFYYRKSNYSADPVIDFTVTNNGANPIKVLFMHGKVLTPGRAIPWVEADFNYEFPGGLEPGETQQISLAPNRFSDWGKVPDTAVNGAVMELKTLAVENALGKKLGVSTGGGDNSERKKALEDGIRILEYKIQQLEAKGGT